MNITAAYDAYSFGLLVTCNWREARGCTRTAKLGQAWSVRNRVETPGWWGHDWASVILCKEQYSSFNPGDPNTAKFPTNDPAFADCLSVCRSVWDKTEPDPTGGATHYYDSRLDENPPKWALSGQMVETITIGALRFWKQKG